MSSLNIAKIGYRSCTMTFLYPGTPPRDTPYFYSSHNVSARASWQMSPSSLLQMDKFFFDALLLASMCAAHANPTHGQARNRYMHHRTRRRASSIPDERLCKLHIARSPSQPPAVIAREEYKQMLDYYREPFSTQASSIRDEVSYCRTLLSIDGLTKQKDIVAEEAGAGRAIGNTTSATKSCGSEEMSSIGEFMDVLRDEDSSHQAIFQAYQSLPFPGVSYLGHETRRRLLRRLSVVETKNHQTMFRYLSVVDDLKAVDLPLTNGEWSSAIAFVGRCFVRISAAEVENALKTWKEMELEAGIEGTQVTFNILFDIAAKAGKFALAEMIFKEMDARQLCLNRFAYVGFIYYQGLKGDGAGIRKAYREFVDAGHIVDTVVMNCVIASLIKAGELPAAEQVYERMKSMLSRKTGVVFPKSTWKSDRDLGRVLDRATKVYKNDKERLRQLQDEQLLAPNLRTFKIFISHHVSSTGELRRVTTLLNEMAALQIPTHGTIFVTLFRGFAIHGGVRYSSWTKSRLGSVWAALLQALNDQQPNVHVEKWMALWAIRAGVKCSGRDMALEIWEELKTRWKPDAREQEMIHMQLKEIMKASSV